LPTLKAPTYMVNVEDDELEGAGEDLKGAIWTAAEDAIVDWTTMKLRPSSLYGIRVYTSGAVLSPHVDRVPLVSSAIVNVAQDVDEPWPIEVYDRSGNAVNITMEPGDMVLYESGSLVHGVSSTNFMVGAIESYKAN
jgi:prolyl 4-hydroxylase